MKIEYTFRTRDLVLVPSLLTSVTVVVVSPYPSSNFQPALAFRLDIKVEVYSFDRGILNIKWLETNTIYEIGAT